MNVDISGFILAGGNSSRMGSDKALLLVEDEPLLQRMIGLLKPVCRTIAISCQRDDYSEFNVPLIPDAFVGYGPIAGLYSSLDHSKTEWNLIVSVDVPFVNEVLFRYLFSGIGANDCVIPEHEAGLEPLVALYSKRCLPVLKEMLLSGDYKLRNLFPKLNTRKLDCNELVQKYPRLFFNLNRPGDYHSV